MPVSFEREATRQILGSTEALAQLLAMAGHDLRQPLQVARLSIERAVEQGLTDQAADRLRLAVAALDRLNFELEDIARVSQLGRASGQIAPVSLDSIFEGIEEDWRNYAEACSITLTVRLSGLLVLSDGRRLKSILRNLVGNAIRYSPRGGAVFVSALVEADAVRLIVEDEGSGIPAKQLDRIFDAFERGSQAEQTEGLGLGLTIARELAMSLGHRMSVHSIDGQGSTFSLFAPRYVAPVNIDHDRSQDRQRNGQALHVIATALR